MSNPLNLKTVTLTRTNANGFSESQKLSVRWLHVDFPSLTATIKFEAWRDDEARAKGAAAIEHDLTLEVDLTDESVAQSVAINSGLIWAKALVTPFIENYEEVAGVLQPVKKSLHYLGAVPEDVDLSEVFGNGEN